MQLARDMGIRKVATRVHIAFRSSACQGHGRCQALAPEFYQLDDDGYLELAPEAAVPPHQEAAARRGAAGCPERALNVLA